MQTIEEKLAPTDYWSRATDLLASFQNKHTEIDKVRDLVRQRITPTQVMEGKYLLTARSAMAWALVAQFRSFFDRATRKVEVMADAKNQKEDRRTTKLERWLLGSSDTVNRRSMFVESNALYHGIESGEMILGAAFDPYQAKTGHFPIEVMAPDPANCAYSRSHYGLTNLVVQESRPSDALQDELMAYRNRAKGAGVFIPDKILKNKPTTAIEDTRYYTKTYEIRWLDGEHIYTRRHFCGRIPFDIAYFYDVPSDRPEEWGRGMISPVRDMLESYQQLIDLFATDAELGQRPLGILFDGMKYEIVQIEPGAQFAASGQGVSLVPVPYNANHQLLHEIAQIIAEQIDIAALPRSTFSGPQIKLSGYAIDLYTQGVRARVDDQKKYPENALASHYGLRLELVKRFATSEMARLVSPDDTDKYLDSFNVVGFSDDFKKGTPQRRVWWALSAEDIGEHPVVNVSISPNLPAEEAARLQKAGEALKFGFPFEYVVRNIYEVENADELLAQRDAEILEASDELWKGFMNDLRKQRLFDGNRQLAKQYFAWLDGQGLLGEGEPPGAAQQMPGPDGQPEAPGAPSGSVPQFIPEDQLLQQQQGLGGAEPGGNGVPQGALAGESQLPPPMSGMLPTNLPPNALTAQVLMPQLQGAR